MKVEFVVKSSDIGVTTLAVVNIQAERYPAIGESIWLNDKIYVVKDVIWRRWESILYIIAPRESERREVERKE